MLDWFAHTWEWVCANPAAAAWLVFGFLTALVLVFRKFEHRLVLWCYKSETKVDDKIVQYLGRVVGLLAIVLDVIGDVVPHFASKRKDEGSASDF